MMALGHRITVLSCILISVWLVIGYLMYINYFSLDSDNDKLFIPKTLEQEVIDCKSQRHGLTPGFWQRISPLKKEIPEQIKESISLVKTNTSSVTIHDTKVHYIYARTNDHTTGIPILLLHGQRFISETWNKIGTIKTLAAFGFYPIAIDLPGYGKSPPIKNLNKSRYLDELITALNIKKPVLVSPSMSGSFSLPYLTEHPEKIGGYIPVSPIHTSILKDSACSNHMEDNIDVNLNEDCQKIMHHLKSNELKLNCIKVPTLVVWGEKDRGENSAKLCLLPESQGVEIPHGEHPVYLSNPDVWHKLLYNFLSLLNETQNCR